MSTLINKRIWRAADSVANLKVKMTGPQTAFANDALAEAGIAGGSMLAHYASDFAVFAYQTYIDDVTGVVTRADNLFGDLDITGLVINDYEFPTSDGNANEVMATDGSGSLTFVDASTFIDHGSIGGLTDDDHLQYLPVDSSRPMEGDLPMGANSIIDVASFDSDVANANETYKKGRLFWSESDQTYHVYTDDPEVIHKVGRGEMYPAYNGESFAITKGQVVYFSGVHPGSPYFDVFLASADTYGLNWVLGVAVQNAAPGEILQISTSREILNVDTSGYSTGGPLYLSNTPGELSDTRPKSPGISYIIGGSTIQSPTAGLLNVNVQRENYDYEFDGCSIEKHTGSYRVVGTSVFIDICNEISGRDIPIPIDGTIYSLDATTAGGSGGCATTELIQGSVGSPLLNFVYVYINAGVATLDSSTTLPGAETCLLWVTSIEDYTHVASEGPLLWQRINNSKNFDGKGRIAYMSETMRARGAQWSSGCAPTAVLGGQSLLISSGYVRQMHINSFASFDTGVDGIVVANVSGSGTLTPYQHITSFDDATELLDGTQVSNKIFHLVVMGLVSSDGALDKLLLLLPSLTYNKNDDSAYYDYRGTATTTVDSTLKGTAFLIARIPLEVATNGTIKGYANPTGSSEVISLRGNMLGTSGGGAAGAALNFSDDVFYVFDNNDSSKQVGFECSSITTGNKRLLTVPDKDGTIAMLDDIRTDEEIEDIIGTNIVAGRGIDVSYDDASGITVIKTVKTIDGGSASTVFPVGEEIDGGSASTVFTVDQVIDGGGA